MGEGEEEIVGGDLLINARALVIIHAVRLPPPTCKGQIQHARLTQVDTEAAGHVLLVEGRRVTFKGGRIIDEPAADSNAIIFHVIFHAGT